MATKQTRAGAGLGVQGLARVGLLGIGLYVAVDIVLRFLRPQYSLVYNAESDYGRGPWSWVMDLNFLLRCALSIALVAALYKTLRMSRQVRVGLGLLVVWAVGSGILAFFADDVEGTPTHGSGTVHLAVAVVSFIAMAAGGLVISVKLRSDPAWRQAAVGPARRLGARCRRFTHRGPPDWPPCPWRANRTDFPRTGAGVDGVGGGVHREATSQPGRANRLCLGRPLTSRRQRRLATQPGRQLGGPGPFSARSFLG